MRDDNIFFLHTRTHVLPCPIPSQAPVSTPDAAAAADSTLAKASSAAKPVVGSLHGYGSSYKKNKSGTPASIRERNARAAAGIKNDVSINFGMSAVQPSCD
jgi:hypothetical protein